MGQGFHTPLTDGLTALNSAGIDAPMTELDTAIGNMGKHAFAIARGPITVDRADSGGGWMRFPIIDIYHHKNDASGTIVRNQVDAGSTNIGGAGTTICTCKYVTLSDVDRDSGGSSLVIASSSDYDALPTLFAKDIFILALRARSTIAGAYSTWWFPSILRMQPIVASWSIGAGVTSTAVAFPAGVVTQNILYMVLLSPTTTVLGKGFYALEPYVAAASKTTSGFTVTHLDSGPGGQAFDYTIIT